MDTNSEPITTKNLLLKLKNKSIEFIIPFHFYKRQIPSSNVIFIFYGRLHLEFYTHLGTSNLSFTIKYFLR